MLTNLKKYNIILASKSPRRKELLEKLGISFKVKIIDGIDEGFPDELSNEQIALYISRKKANVYRKEMYNDDLIITADTIVCCENQVLGKPANKEDARRMLHLLSGKEHEVVTGITVTSCERCETFAVTTYVRFDVLNDELIEEYIDKFSPYDKAGAYGIQDWIGYVGVTEIKGSFFNVVGLPVQKLFKILQTF